MITQVQNILRITKGDSKPLPEASLRLIVGTSSLLLWENECILQFFVHICPWTDVLEQGGVFAKWPEASHRLTIDTLGTFEGFVSGRLDKEDADVRGESAGECCSCTPAS